MKYQDRIQLVALGVLFALLAFLGIPHSHFTKAPPAQGKPANIGLTTPKIEDSLSLTQAVKPVSPRLKQRAAAKNLAQPSLNNTSGVKKAFKNNPNARRTKATQALLLAFIRLGAGSGAL